MDRLRGVKQIPGFGLFEGSGTKGALVISSNPSLVLQAALTAANAGHTVVVVMGGDRWTRMPPTFHLMPRPSTTAMASIRFWYPSNLAELTQLIYKEDVVARTVIVFDADIPVQRSLRGMIGGGVSENLCSAFCNSPQLCTSEKGFTLVSRGVEGGGKGDPQPVDQLSTEHDHILLSQ